MQPVLRSHPAATRQLVLSASAMALAVAVGAASARSAAVPVVASGIVLVVALAAWVVRRVSSWLAVGALTLTGGYVVLNRGFAGLNVPLGSFPLYVGELGLAVLLVAALRVPAGRRLDGPLAVVALWMAFNALVTLPQIPTYGLTSVRDAAIWYYALFVWIGVAVWQRVDTAQVRRWFAGIYLLAFLALPVSLVTAAGAFPQITLPFDDSPLIGAKWDIATMFLIGAASLFLTSSRVRRTPWPRWSTPLLLGLALCLVVLPQHRASVMGLLGAMLLLAVFRMWRAVAVTLLAVLGALFVLWTADFDMPSMRGTVSSSSIIERQVSVVMLLSGENTSAHDVNNSTVYWRTIWWQALWEEALADPRILILGRGYGPDLRETVASKANGFMNWEQNVDSGRPVRSPHNIAATIVARSGLVGAAIWLAMLGAVFLRLVRASMAARRRNDPDGEAFGVWLATCLGAILVVSLFGVVLESPMGAIPFFFLTGLGLGWARDQVSV